LPMELRRISGSIRSRALTSKKFLFLFFLFLFVFYCSIKWTCFWFFTIYPGYFSLFFIVFCQFFSFVFQIFRGSPHPLGTPILPLLIEYIDLICIVTMVTYFYTFFIKQYTKIQKIDENPRKINTGISGSPGVGGVYENSNSSKKHQK
jgi:hypothetical protein